MKENGLNGLNRQWQAMLVQVSRLRRGRALQSAALLGGGSGLAQAIMAANAILLARHLNPDFYGLFIAAYAAAGLSSFLFNWGLDTWLLRQAAIGRQPARLLGDVLFIKAGFGLVWGLALFTWLPRLRPDLFLAPLVLVSCLDVFSDGLFTAQTSTLNAQRRVPAVASLLLFSRSARLLATVLLILLGAQSPVQFAQARLAGTLFALLLALFVLRPQFGRGILESAAGIFRQSIPYGFSDLLATIYLQADITLLALLLGDERAVGLYAPASAMIAALFVILAAVYSVTIPILARLNEAGSEDFRRAVKLMFAGFTMTGSVLWMGIWASGRMVTELLLGSAYQVTGQLLVILSPILLLKAISFASAAFLVAVGWQRRRLGPQAISASANLLLNLAAIPLYGIWGVAVVYVISEAILTLGYLFMTARWFRINPG